MDEQYISSPGEEIIEEFLEEKNIPFQREFQFKVKNDYADYRIADFYLTRYKVYLEFLGRWDVPTSKEKYRKKKEIYAKGNIPCVYIYPDNLGILEFIFYRRLREVLKQHSELKFQLFRFNLDLFQEKHILLLVGIGALIYFMKGWPAKIIFSLIFILALCQALKSTFFKK